MRLIKGALFALFVLTIGRVNGQSISSVYSDRGIGIPNYQGLPNNMAMGEVGIAVPSNWNLNYQNPAFLPFNQITVFQVGLEMDRRNLTNGEQSTKEVTAGLRYFNFAFPILAGKWTTSFGVTPYTTVNYKSYAADLLNNNQTTVVTSYSGKGGITALNWANGFRLSEELFLGVRASYLFGTIEDRARSFLSDDLGADFVVDFLDESSYKGTRLELSAGYRKMLGEDKALNFGLVYELAGDLDGKNTKKFETLDGSGIVLQSRAVVENVPFLFTMPTSIGFGTSFQLLNNYSVGVDIKSTNWSKAGESSNQFVNTLNIGVGAQWTPNYNSVTNYWNRVTYRFGVNFGELPYTAGGEAIKDFGINFGSSLPVGLSSLDLAFKYGVLGTTDNNLIRESYFRIVIGATMNDRWFVKRRYD